MIEFLKSKLTLKEAKEKAKEIKQKKNKKSNLIYLINERKNNETGSSRKKA
jgi:hypothetical protein